MLGDVGRSWSVLGDGLGRRDDVPPAQRSEPGPRCAWCGKPIAVKQRGRRPKWCSSSCRHRAWEQRRAAASGPSAVEVVERVIERVIERERVVEVRLAPRGREWADALEALVNQLESGRLYDRDLDHVVAAAAKLYESLERRLRYRRRSSRTQF